jgi:hypothetical protein
MRMGFIRLELPMAVKWLASYLSALLQIFGITILALEAVLHSSEKRGSIKETPLARAAIANGAVKLGSLSIHLEDS